MAAVIFHSDFVGNILSVVSASLFRMLSEKWAPFSYMRRARALGWHFWTMPKSTLGSAPN